MQFRNPISFNRPQQPQRKESDGRKCKVKIKRDGNGRIIGYESEGCSRNEVEAFIQREKEDSDEMKA